MNIISLPRGNGKTTQLIKISAETGMPILTISKQSAVFIFDRAKELNLNIPFVLIIENKKIIKFNNSCTELFCTNIKDIKEILIDELDIILKELLGCDVNTATITEIKEDSDMLIKTLSESINTLMGKYNQAIDKNDINGGLNILKNVDMIIRDIDTIQRTNLFKERIVGKRNISQDNIFEFEKCPQEYINAFKKELPNEINKYLNNKGE